jgi:two-component system alkaline phosphatase synthesis response regulator PhoP
MENNSFKKILLVEDEPAILKALVFALSREGFLVLEAKDGQEGLDSAFKNHPDLILLDVIMPKMSGAELMQKLRKDAWGKNVPAIFYTNLSRTEVELKGEDIIFKTETTLRDVIIKIKQKLGSVNPN